MYTEGHWCVYHKELFVHCLTEMRDGNTAHTMYENLEERIYWFYFIC